MLGVFNTITIDSNVIYRGNDFTLQREWIYAGEYETCTGKRCADLVGWRYSDLTISWDNLPQAQLDALLNLTGAEVTMTFSNEKGTSVNEKVIPRIITSQASRLTDVFGSVSWINISLQLQFTEAHN